MLSINRRAAILFLFLLKALNVEQSFAADPESNPTSPLLIIAPRYPENYGSASAEIGLTGKSILETPASATIIPRALLDDQGARGALGYIGNDASLGENYAPLGYYEALSVRGFSLDNASGYKRNGLTIANESSMPLENKERVEILKGVAGFEAGLAAPGGVINYVTKQPTGLPVRRVTAELSGRGTRYAHADLGGRFGSFGYRFNAAREDFHPYVKEAVGRRDFLSAALEWRLGEKAVFGVDADWQKKSQLSVPGYQLLGGDVLASDIRPEKMLNNQPWSEPVAVEAHNIGARFAYGNAPDWRFEAAVNRNRVAAEDNAAFPYGCSSGPTYLTTFCDNGDYDLYDYRSSGEVRDVVHAQAVVSGRQNWSEVSHDVALGLSRFNRAVNLGSEVYEYVGTDNIYNPNPRAFAPSPRGTGIVHRTQDYAELGAFIRDSISLTAQWKVSGSLRAVVVSDDRFGKVDGVQISRYRRSFFLPGLALVFAPQSDLMSYVSYSQGLELGGTAGITTANAGQTLDPKVTRQAEVGVKRGISDRLLATAAAFHVWKPYEFVDPNNAFVQRGAVKHSGLEFTAAGRAADDLRLFASATLIHARQSNTGVGIFDGRAPVNVPWLRSRVTLDWNIPGLAGAGVNGSWARVSEKYALRDNSLSVPAYNRFDLGLRYAVRAGPTQAIWRFRIENILDAVYWKDVGEYFGDGYLHLGAPRTFSLSLQMDF